MLGGSVVDHGRAAASIPSSCSTPSSSDRDQLDVDRRRRVRQADPARPRRRAGSLGHLVAARRSCRRGVMWSAGDQGRPAAPQRPADHGRLARIERGDRHGARARPRPDGAAETATFTPRPEHPGRHRRRPRRRAWGSGERGPRGAARSTPVGYYKDPEKSAATFRVIDGVRYTIPGDFATVDADGTVRLLGRGSQCINTGGEKVYPEEVEEALKLHPTVADAAVVGVPDERFGEAITALVEPDAGRRARRGRADRPRQGRSSPRTRRRSGSSTSPSVGRAPNGKLDYKALKAVALAAVRD